MVSGGVVIVVAMAVVAVAVPSFWLFRASRADEVARDARRRLAEEHAAPPEG